MRRLLITILSVAALLEIVYPGNGWRHIKEPGRSPVTKGVYSGNTDQSMAEFEAFVGAKLDVYAKFWGWDSDFPKTNAGAEGKTLLIFWDPDFGYDEINSGSQDQYIADFAEGAKNYGYPVILVPFSEFNLNEAAWGNTIGTNTPEKFKAAWKLTHNIFQVSGATNVKFGLAYNNVSIPSAPFADFYPGDEFVDYVGVDGFNMDTQTFAETFNDALEEAGKFGKPLWIFSTGSVAPKQTFIYDLGQSGLPWIWFNEEPYNIDSSSLSSFQSILE